MEVQAAVDGAGIYRVEMFLSSVTQICRQWPWPKLASMLEARFPNLKGNVEVQIGHIIGHTPVREQSGICWRQKISIKR